MVRQSIHTAFLVSVLISYSKQGKKISSGPQTIIQFSSGNSHIRFNSYYTLFPDRAEAT